MDAVSNQPLTPGAPVRMPSLMRFLTVVAILGGIVYAGLYLLANLVDPAPREITVNVPIEKAKPQP